MEKGGGRRGERRECGLSRKVVVGMDDADVVVGEVAVHASYVDFRHVAGGALGGGFGADVAGVGCGGR